MQQAKMKQHRGAYAQKRQEIIRAAEKRFIRHGLHKTTIEEIARDLRIGKASLYHYFSTKEDLFNETVKWQSSDYLQEVSRIFNNESVTPVTRVASYLMLKKEFGNRYKLLEYVLNALLNDNFLPGEDELVHSLVSGEANLVQLALASWLPSQNEQMCKKLGFALTILGMSLNTSEKIFSKIFIGNDPSAASYKEFIDLLLRALALEPPTQPEKFQNPSVS